MTKTLLAVDDSATMRKVLEITFSGDDFRVVTADGPQAALAKMAEEPSVFLIDTLLGKDDGYALCAEIRRRDPKATIVLLASRHNPYDAARGRDAGADDFVDKPFDTQQMIDKVKKTVLGREQGGSAVAAPPQAAAPQPPVQRPQAPPPGPPPSAPAGRVGVGPGAGAPQRAVTPERARARTLMFGDTGGAPDDAREASPQPPAAAPAGTSGHTKPSAAIYPQSRPQPPPAPAARPAAPAPSPPATAHVSPKAPAVAPAAAPRAAPAAVASSVNGHLAGKLGELGLSAQQIDAVVALSREVVEQVVWEVVPQLAEALIKEEIARLTKEG